MNYIIKQNRDYIDIFQNDDLFLKIRQRANFWDKKTLNFYKNDVLILTIIDKDAFFSREWTIMYQNLANVINFKKNKNSYCLIFDKSIITLKAHLFSNPFYSIHLDSKQIGFVSTIEKWSIGYPVYSINLDCAEQEALHCLILLVMKMPSSLDE